MLHIIDSIDWQIFKVYDPLQKGQTTQKREKSAVSKKFSPVCCKKIMPIIYSVVARETTVLAEHAAATGTFREVTKKILEKIPTNHNNKMSYVYER